MKIKKLIALLILTVSVSFPFIGCTVHESKTEPVNKDVVNNEKDSSDASNAEQLKEGENQAETVHKDAINNEKDSSDASNAEQLKEGENQAETANKDAISNENTMEPVNDDAISDEKNSSDTSILEQDEESKNQSEYLKKDNEEIIYSFSIVDSDNVVAVCVSKEEPSYIVYRFGTSKIVEFEYPDNLASSWDNFIYSYYLRGGSIENEGLDLNYLTFEDSGKRYQIFQEYTSENDTTGVGLRITDLATYEETILNASEDSINGDLRDLRDNDKITIEVQ